MMAGCKTLPSKGRIQMSQTNYLQIVKSGLQRTAGPYISAMCGRLRVGKSFLYVCSIGRCSHVFGEARHTGPLAIMPSADQVPVNRDQRTAKRKTMRPLQNPDQVL